MSPEIIERSTEPDVRRLLSERIDAHNLETTGIRDWHPLTFVVRDASGDLAGGVDGWEWGGTCFVNSLWVRDDRRGAGLGTALMDAMEPMRAGSAAPRWCSRRTASRHPRSTSVAGSSGRARSPATRAGQRSS